MPLGDYASMLKSAQSSYQAMINGYNTALSNQSSAQQAVEGGYSQLYHDVLSGIKDVGTSQSQAIADTYAQKSGSAMQGLINSGLGNTTVQSSVGRGLTLDEQKAQIALANQTSQLYAGYQSQLGLAGLNYRGQAIQQNSQLQSQQLGAMGQMAQSEGNWALQGYSIDAQLRAQQLRQAGMGGTGSSGVMGAPGGGNLSEGPAYRGSQGPSGGGSMPSQYLPGVPNPNANFQPAVHDTGMQTYTPGAPQGGQIQSFPFGAYGGFGADQFGGEQAASQGWGALPQAAQDYSQSYVGGGDQ